MTRMQELAGWAAVVAIAVAGLSTGHVATRATDTARPIGTAQCGPIRPVPDPTG